MVGGSGNGQGMTAELGGLAKYSVDSAEMAAETLAGAAIQSTQSSSALAAVLGPIGAEYVAAFGVAEQSYLDGARRVSAAQANMSTTTAIAAAGYEGVDLDNAAAFEVK